MAIAKNPSLIIKMNMVVFTLTFFKTFGMFPWTRINFKEIVRACELGNNWWSNVDWSIQVCMILQFDSCSCSHWETLTLSNVFSSSSWSCTNAIKGFDDVMASFAMNGSTWCWLQIEDKWNNIGTWDQKRAWCFYFEKSRQKQVVKTHIIMVEL